MEAKDRRVDILTVLLGLGVSLLVAAVPFAYSVHGRLSMIETTLQMMIPSSKLASKAELSELQTRVRWTEMVIYKHLSIMPPSPPGQEPPQ